MRFKPTEDVSREKIKTPDGKTVVRDYVAYDPRQDRYLDSTKCWGTHYIEYVYGRDGELLGKTLKENDLAKELNDFQTEFAKKHSI